MTRPVQLVLILLLVACGEAAEERPTLQVAVASNFRDTALELAQRFEEKRGCEVVISSGSTGRLQAQIEKGAPFDLFLSADRRHAEALVSSGHADPDRMPLYAIGRVVLATSKGNPTPKLAMFSGDYWPREDRLAMPDPTVAPYGRAALSVLIELGYIDSPFDNPQQAMGLPETPRLDAERRPIVWGASVGQTAHFLVSGGVHFAMLPLPVAKKLELPHAVVNGKVAEVRQHACVLTDSELGGAFLDYLQSDEARAIIVKAGYEVEPR